MSTLEDWRRSAHEQQRRLLPTTCGQASLATVHDDTQSSGHVPTASTRQVRLRPRAARNTTPKPINKEREWSNHRGRTVNCYAVARPSMLRVAVIVPMYNEADNVAALLERLAGVREHSGLNLSAIAVDDGSRDATYVRLGELAPQYPFLKIVRHTRNRGMAAALRTGIGEALAERGPGFDALAFMDADLTHAPEDLPRLIGPIDEDRADFVLGSRYVPGGKMRGVPWARRAISIVGNAAVRRLLGVQVGDLTSGFRAARADVFRTITLQEQGFGIQLEGTVKTVRAGYRVAEVPITLGVRKNGYSKMAYTRSFWLGYARLILGLWLSRQATNARVVDSLARISYAKVEDT
jgi:dolichol-phosphate mannosyltransferase